MAVRIGELLLKEKRITPEQLQEALNYQRQNGGKLGYCLIKLGLAKDEPAAEDLEEAGLEDEALPAGGGVKVEIDKVTLIPGALASGSVAFSDGVSAKWIIDQMGRPGFTEVSQPGYRPSPEDGQAFMQELSMQLQRRGY